MSKTHAATRPRPRNSLSRTEQRWGIAFALPAIIGFIVFTAGPMIASIFVSLTDWTIGGTPEFVGTANYTDLVIDPRFWAALKATALYAILAVPGTVVVAFFVASLLKQVQRARGFFRVAFYLPVLVPPVASAVLWMWLYEPDSGLLNSALRALRLPTSQWIYSESSVIPSLALAAVWGFGNMAIVFLAALQGVPQQLYEAAALDGAGVFNRLWHVTIPQVSPIILFNLITGLISAVQSFDSAYVMTSGGPNDASLFYVFYLYTKAFADGQLGAASAMAWVLFLIIVIVTAALFRSSRMWVFSEESSK